MENILKRLGSLSGVVAEKQKQIEEEKKRPRRELEEQIAGAQRNYDTFTHLAESGDYASLRGIAFEMYSGALDDKLSVTEGNTPAISKKELEELSAVLGQLDAVEQTALNSGDKGLQNELSEMKEEVAVGMREYAGRIASRFGKLLENYKTQLEAFSDDPNMIAPVEVHEKSFETMAAEAKRQLLIGTFLGYLGDDLQKNDSYLKDGLKKYKEGAYVLGTEFDKAAKKIAEEISSPEDQRVFLEYATNKISFQELTSRVQDLKPKMSVLLAAQMKNLISFKQMLNQFTTPRHSRIDDTAAEQLINQRRQDFYAYGGPRSYDRALVVLQHPNAADAFEWDKAMHDELGFRVKKDAVANGILTEKEADEFEKSVIPVVSKTFGTRDVNLDTYAAICYIKAKVSSEAVSSPSVRVIMEDIITHTQNPDDLDKLVKSLPESGGTIKIESVSQATALADKLRIRAADSLQQVRLDAEKSRKRSSVDQEIARLSEAELKTERGRLDAARQEIKNLKQAQSGIYEEKDALQRERDKLKRSYDKLENDTRFELAQLSQTVETRRKEAESAQRTLAKIKELLDQANPDAVGMFNAKAKYTELVSELLRALRQDG